MAFAAVNAVTVTLNAAPTVAVEGAETEKCVATGALTVIVPEVPVMDPVTVSVAVMVCGPLVFSVAEKVLTPAVSVEFNGKAAAPSLLVKCTVPGYPVAVLPNVSSAVTVKLNAVPLLAAPGAATVKWVAAAGLTVIAAVVPVIEAVTVSVAVTVCEPAVLSVTEKFPVPAVRVAFAGKTAWPSLLVMCTIPVYPVAVAFEASRAVTATLNATPAV